MLMDVLDHVQRGILRLRGFRSRHVRTSVGAVHVLEADGRGDGPPVVVQHGISAAGAHFWSVLPRLLPHTRRVVVPDMPGHGFSDVPEGGLTADSLTTGLTEALDALIDEPVVFYGNSLGGIAAIRFAGRRPEKVRALLLNSPGGAPMAGDALAAFVANFRMRSHADAVAFVDKIHARPPWYRRLIANGVRGRFERPAMSAFLDHIQPEHLLDPAEVAALSMPVMLLWGRNDTLMPREHLEFFRAHLPGHAVVEEPDGFGHCPYLDTPGRLTEAIVRFTREHARPRLVGA